MNKQKVAMLALTLGVAGILAYGSISSVYAQEVSNYSPVVQALVDKFNLNTGDVDAVISEVRSTRQAQMLMDLENKLTNAVANKTITNEQKEKILTFVKSRQEEHIAKVGIPSEQRHAERDEHRVEIETFANDLGISEDTLRDLLGGGRKMGSRQFGRNN